MSNNGGLWFYNLPYTDRIKIVKLFESLPYLIQLNLKDKQIGVAHADLPSKDWKECLLLAEQNCQVDGRYPLDIITWSRNTANNIKNSFYVDHIKNIDEVYLGHTVVQTALKSKNINLIDTGAVFTNKFTMVRLQ